MADKYHGYDGGQSEESLIAAIHGYLDDEEGDTITKLKTKYWPMGHAVEIAMAKGYTKAMGLKGWFYHNFQRSETHARDCLAAWRCRRQFNDAYKWWKSGNTSFMPQKLSGPRFCVELCKAYEKRLEEPKSKRKGPTMKQMRAALATYRSSLDRLRGEHLTWTVQDERESRVLPLIEQEIADAEAEINPSPGDGQWPLNATRDTEEEGEENDNTEPDDVAETQDTAKEDVPEPEHTRGAGFVTEKITPAPKRRSMPIIAPRRLRLPGSEPAPVKKKRGRPAGSKNKPKSG